jgi:hypothetical protein
MENNKLPNFLCIGAQKAGTTLLYEILKQHPQIFLPQIKEVHFFDIDENFCRGIEWYKEHFSGSEHSEFVGDITPAYIFFDYVPERIQTTLGTHIKLLTLLRNPVDRAYSHYWMSFKRGYEKLPFEEAMIMEHSRMRKGYFEKSHFSYTSRGFYSEQIKRYLSFFSKKNMMILILEEFIKDVKVSIKPILDFLGCTAPFEFSIDNKVHAGDLSISQYLKAITTDRYLSFGNGFTNLKKVMKDKQLNYPPLKRKTRSLLLELYKDDINELEMLLNKDLSFWREY